MENTIAKCIATVLITLILVASGCTIAQKVIYAENIKQAIENHVDPMRVGCSWGVNSDPGNTAICVQAIANTPK